MFSRSGLGISLVTPKMARLLAIVSHYVLMNMAKYELWQESYTTQALTATTTQK